MSSPDARALRGGCLCGAVAYAVPDAFEYAMNCHCGQCRRATGSAFKPMGGLPADKVRLTAGEDRVLVVGDPSGSHDRRCRDCGSLLYSIVREGQWAHVAYGTLIDPPALAPTHHIMVAHKAPWFTIADGLPQHAEF